MKSSAVVCMLVVSCANADGQEQHTVAPSPSSAPANAPPAPSAPAPEEPFEWPNALPEEVAFDLPKRAKPVVVYLDAGHGAKDNPGNTSSFCALEQDFTRSLALDVRSDLEELGGVRVVLSRTGAEMVSYGERVEAARRVGSDVFVSLHSDVRGTPAEWSPDGAAICRRSVEAPGFSVLYSDEGADKIVRARRSLADSIGAALLEAKFIPYLGEEYVDLYEPIPSDTGVFVDRHEDKKRIFILRRTTMPTVIVETHNALDPREALAFEDPIVRRAFSLALAKGIFSALSDR